MEDDGFKFPEQSRYAKVARQSRRRFMTTASAAGVAAVLAACSQDGQPELADSTDVSTGDASGQTAAPSSDTVVASDGQAAALRVETDPAVVAENVDSTSSSSSSSSSTGSTETTVGSGEETTTSQTSTTAETSTSSTETSRPTTSENSTTPTQQETTTTTSNGGGAGSALPAGAAMAVSFTYEQQSGGKDVPPYIAVWIEDGNGNLLQTVSLWYQQFGRGERWLPDLRRWYQVDQSRISNGGADNVAAISGATRSPGNFQVRWDGKANGTTVPAGWYHVCIESARERGPYSLIRQAVDLQGSATKKDLSNDSELVNASVTVA